MQFLASWRDSLLLLKPDNAKLFGLVTINACLIAWRTLILNCWWLVLATGVLVIRDAAHWLPLPVISLLLLMFAVYLASRPPTLRKDGSYFIGYGKHYVAFVLFFVLWLILLCSLSGLGIPCWFSSLPLYAPLFPFFSITVAFLCDSDGSCRSATYSVYRGFLFVFYNFPMCAVLGILFLATGYLISMLGYCISAIILILFWPVPVCTYINLYVKRIHEQFPLYFGDR